MNVIAVTGRKLLSQEGYPCHKKDIRAMEGNSHERNSCQWKDIPVTGKKFLSKEGNSGYRKGIPATR